MVSKSEFGSIDLGKTSWHAFWAVYIRLIRDIFYTHKPRKTIVLLLAIMKSYENHLSELNEEQRKAVEKTEGALIILAGAGAGKTKTLTHRIFNIIKKGTAPESVLAVTFTNKAAREMRERVLGLLETEGSWHGEIPFVSTFHALGVHVLREQYQHHKRTKYFSIIDQKDALSLIKEAIKELDYDPKVHEPRKIKSIISKQKGRCLTCVEYMDSSQSYLSEIIGSIWEKYEEKLAQENAYDFDDLLFETVKLLEENSSVREFYNNRWEYIHIDEYQDTNESQYRITQALASKRKNICVVGDGDQTIYSWRGADISNILNFEKDYPEAETVILEQNYRSTKKILEAANSVIKKNKHRKEKNLFTNNKDGENVFIYQAINDRREASFVQDTIDSLMIKNPEISFNDIAILYRANFQSRILEEAMLSANIPYYVLGTKFFDRKEVKDVLAYIRASLNDNSLSDIKRVINTPRRGIGKVTIAKLFAGKRDELPMKTQIKINKFYDILAKIKEAVEKRLPSEVVKMVLDLSGLKESLEASGTEEDIERLENMQELVNFAVKYDQLGELAGMEKMIEDAALASDQDTLGQKDDVAKPGIKMMTVHASKGLEFPYVFIVGLEQDLFPHSFGNEKLREPEQEEERRLFYVALTRAKEQLFLSHAMIRYMYGEQHFQESSEFLQDIPVEIVDNESDSHGSKDGSGDEKIEYLDIDLM